MRTAVVIVSVGLACSHGATGPNAHDISDIIMTPDTLAIAVGGTATIQARPVTASGATVSGVTLFWSTNDPSIATVDQQGRVTAVALGAVNVDASAAGVSPTQPARVTIGVVPVASVVVAPSSDTLRVGDVFQFSDTTKDGSGHVLTGRPVAWSSSDTTIARVDQSGLVQGIRTGSATIMAASGTARGSAMVTVFRASVTRVVVTPGSATIFATTPGNAVGLTATTTPAGGAVTWSNGGATVAQVDGNGRVTATGAAAGSATITATSTNSSANGLATITVIGHVQTVTPHPGATVLSVLGSNSTTATATLQDTFGTDVSSQRKVTWTSSDPNTITINNSTTAVVANPATTTVTLTAVSTRSPSVTVVATTDDGASGSVTITVLP